MMNSADKLMDMLCSELDEIAEKGQLSAGDLDTIHKLIVSKEKLLRIDELEQNLGYSQDGGWTATGTYSRDDGYMNGRYMGAYRNGHSYANRGRYSRNGYSRAEGKEMMMQQMQDMMNDGNISQSEKMTLQKAMDIVQQR